MCFTPPHPPKMLIHLAIVSVVSTLSLLSVCETCTSADSKCYETIFFRRFFLSWQDLLKLNITSHSGSSQVWHSVLCIFQRFPALIMPNQWDWELAAIAQSLGRQRWMAHRLGRTRGTPGKPNRKTHQPLEMLTRPRDKIAIYKPSGLSSVSYISLNFTCFSLIKALDLCTSITATSWQTQFHSYQHDFLLYIHVLLSFTSVQRFLLFFFLFLFILFSAIPLEKSVIRLWNGLETIYFQGFENIIFPFVVFSHFS